MKRFSESLESNQPRWESTVWPPWSTIVSALLLLLGGNKTNVGAKAWKKIICVLTLPLHEMAVKSQTSCVYLQSAMLHATVQMMHTNKLAPGNRGGRYSCIVFQPNKQNSGLFLKAELRPIFNVKKSKGALKLNEVGHGCWGTTWLLGDFEVYIFFFFLKINLILWS